MFQFLVFCFLALMFRFFWQGVVALEMGEERVGSGFFLIALCLGGIGVFMLATGEETLYFLYRQAGYSG